MNKSSQIAASKVAHYFMIYCAYLSTHKLPDDSETIKVPDLIYFVDQHIDEDEQIVLMNDTNLIDKFTINHN